jgi:cephalosporin-C deacetylase
MPLVDLPLAELELYQGRNPRPKDFDEFWDAGLAEMRLVDPQLELKPHVFKQSIADCYELRFTGVGGARVFAKLLVPKNLTAPAPAILGFHGYSMHSGDWADKLGYVANGAVVAFMDCRGQGGRSEDVGGVSGTTLNGHIIRGLGGNPDKMLYRQIFLDCAQLAGIIMDMPEVDATRVGATGGSQGGGLTLACAALEPRIKKAAPVYPFLSDYQRVWEMDLATQAYSELKTYFRNHDPRHERKEEIFTQLGYIDIQYLAPRIEAEVLMATGLMDTITPPSTQFAAFNKIKSTKKNVFYPDFGHEGLPGLNDIIFEFLGDL